MNIKMTFKLLLLASLIVATGCVKQKNCDCSMTGTWQYLEEFYETQTACSTKKEKIVAHFYPDNTQQQEQNKDYMCFTGKIPKEFQSSAAVRVNICSKDVCAGEIQLHYAGPGISAVYKLVCIEEMED